MDLYPMQDAKYPAYSVAYTGTAGSTTAWPLGPRGVFVWATTDCYVKVGDGVTATTTSTPLPAYTPALFEVPNKGVDWRVSAIQISSAGTVYAKPMGGV